MLRKACRGISFSAPTQLLLAENEIPHFLRSFGMAGWRHERSPRVCLPVHSAGAAICHPVHSADAADAAQSMPRDLVLRPNTAPAGRERDSSYPPVVWNDRLEAQPLSYNLSSCLHRHPVAPSCHHFDRFVSNGTACHQVRPPSSRSPQPSSHSRDINLCKSARVRLTESGMCAIFSCNGVYQFALWRMWNPTAQERSR